MLDNLSIFNSPGVSLSTHIARPHAQPSLSSLTFFLSFFLSSKDREKSGDFDRSRRTDGRTRAHSLVVTTCYWRRRTTVESVTTLTLLFFLENLELYLSMFSHVYEFCLTHLYTHKERWVDCGLIFFKKRGVVNVGYALSI